MCSSFLSSNLNIQIAPLVQQNRALCELLSSLSDRSSAQFFPQLMPLDRMLVRQEQRLQQGRAERCGYSSAEEGIQ